MKYRQIRVISGKGPGPDRFAEALRGIWIDSSGSLYAAGDSEVKVLSTEGELKRRWSTSKPGYSVAVTDDGAVYVGEVGRLERFDASGQLVDTWTDDERLGVVTAIDFHGDYVIIADALDRCLRRFDKTGKWINNIGKDNRTKGFLIPNRHLDFRIDAEGIIHACNPAKFRVERYTLEGELLGHFGHFGTKRPENFPGCCNPTNMTLDGKGHVFVTEKAGPRMKVYDQSGELLTWVGNEPFDPNCKNMDIAVDANGLVYVVDTVRLRICVFAPQEAGE
ncbi:MAG: NHL repeat-containing protein [Phycisphaerae bacterium]|jgi:sugar lactone lactonase YvrE